MTFLCIWVFAVNPPLDKQKPSSCSSWLLASLTTGGLDTMQAALATCMLFCLYVMQNRYIKLSSLGVPRAS